MRFKTLTVRYDAANGDNWTQWPMRSLLLLNDAVGPVGRMAADCTQPYPAADTCDCAQSIPINFPNLWHTTVTTDGKDENSADILKAVMTDLFQDPRAMQHQQFSDYSWECFIFIGTGILFSLKTCIQKNLNWPQKLHEEEICNSNSVQFSVEFLTSSNGVQSICVLSTHLSSLPLDTVLHTGYSCWTQEFSSSLLFCLDCYVITGIYFLRIYPILWKSFCRIHLKRELIRCPHLPWLGITSGNAPTFWCFFIHELEVWRFLIPAASDHVWFPIRAFTHGLLETSYVYVFLFKLTKSLYYEVSAP